MYFKSSILGLGGSHLLGEEGAALRVGVARQPGPGLGFRFQGSRIGAWGLGSSVLGLGSSHLLGKEGAALGVGVKHNSLALI